MSPYLWAGLAGAAAVGTEFAFRSGADWLRNLWWVIPGAVLINYSVYRLITTEYGWLAGIVLFGLVTALLRIGLAFGVLHEPLTAGNLVPAGVLAVGAVLKFFVR